MTKCGQKLTESDAELILRTKPNVGRVRTDGSLFEDFKSWCGRCVPNTPDSDDDEFLEEGGRFGAHTEIDRWHRFSSEMNSAAVRKALDSQLLFDVAGESFRPGYPDNLLRLAEVLRNMDGREWLSAVLRRDPENSYDPNAIEVHVPGGSGHCGYVPAELAAILAPILDGGTIVSASAVEVRIHPNAADKPGLTIALSFPRTDDAHA